MELEKFYIKGKLEGAISFIENRSAEELLEYRKYLLKLLEALEEFTKSVNKKINKDFYRKTIKRTFRKGVN